MWVHGVHSSLTFSPVHFSDMATYECHVTLTPLLGPASPVSSSASIFLNISTRSSFEDVTTITTMEITSGIIVVAQVEQNLVHKTILRNKPHNHTHYLQDVGNTAFIMPVDQCVLDPLLS